MKHTAAFVLALLFFSPALAAPRSVVVARWRGGDLTLDRFHDRLAVERLKIELRTGRALPEQGTARAQIAAAVLEGLVRHVLFREEARRRGLRVSPGEVRRARVRLARDARLTPGALARKLAAAGASAASLQASLHDELLLRKLVGAERRKIRVPRARMEKLRAEARWRGEGHLPDAMLRGRHVEREVAARLTAVADSLRRDANVQVFLKAEDALAERERQEVAERALSFYRARNPGAPADLTAQVVPMGCHSEITISRAGRRLFTLGYSGGKVYELGGK